MYCVKVQLEYFELVSGLILDSEKEFEDLKLAHCEFSKQLLLIRSHLDSYYAAGISVIWVTLVEYSERLRSTLYENPVFHTFRIRTYDGNMNSWSMNDADLLK